MMRIRYAERHYYDRNFGVSDIVSVIPHVLHGDFPEHGHDYTEVTIVRSGRAQHSIAGERTSILRGDVIVVPRSASHAFVRCDRLEHFNIAFPGAFLQRIDADIRSLAGFRLFAHTPEPRTLRLPALVMTEIEQLMERLLAELSLRSEGHKAITRIIASELIARLSRAYASRSAGGESAGPLSRVAGYIEANWNRPLTLRELAERFGSSARHFDRVFKAHYRITPVEHILRLRIQRAQEMLASTNRAVTDIAFDCGFSDSNYFSRQFKRLTGKRPRDARATHAPHH